MIRQVNKMLYVKACRNFAIYRIALARYQIRTIVSRYENKLLMQFQSIVSKS
jgi:hypothetical protein